MCGIILFQIARGKNLHHWVTSRKDLETFRDVFGSLDGLVPDDRNEINKYSNSTNEKDCL